MAISGTTDFTDNCNALILQSLGLLGVYGKGLAIDPEDLTYARNALNLMLKAWEASNIHLWCKVEGVLYPQQYQREYILSGAAGVYVTSKNQEVITTLSTSYNVGNTSIVVTNSTGLLVNDYIGIVQNDNSLFWSTIVTISGNTLTLNAYPLVGVTKNAIVYTFTTLIPKPLRILDARYVTGLDSGNASTRYEVILNPMGYEDYMHLTMKDVDGDTRQYCYNPEVNDGILYLWPRPSNCNFRVEFTYERPIDDLTTATDNFDLPEEWQETIVYQLATRVAPRWGKEEKVALLIAPMAQQMLESMKMWDTEITSIFMQPDDERGR
jgi:hypothetical protein